jgi:hypothetical protein
LRETVISMKKLCLLIECPDPTTEDELTDIIHKALLAGQPSLITGGDIEVKAAYLINTPITEISFATHFLNNKEAERFDQIRKGNK